MRIFELQTPITEQIKKKVGAYLATLTKPQPVIYLDFEPGDGYVRDQAEADQDGNLKKVAGFICVYGHIPSFPAGQGSQDDTQNSTSQLIIDCYGFGDSVDDIQSMKEAENRAQAFTTLAYKAIMDRQVEEGSGTVAKNYGVSFDIGEKSPVSVQKFPSQEVMVSSRTIAAYRSIYNFLLEEDVPGEPLGLPFAGSDDITSDTYDPGQEPG